MGATTLYGFSNIDVGKQIVVVEKRVFAGISRANQTISIYHGETLIADCTMPSAGMENFPTVVSEELTLHDDTFTGFIDGETYTIVAGGEPSITGFVMNGLFLSFDGSVLWGILHYAGQIIAQDFSASRTNYAISQKITTTKKRYDIKRLPEELLPKTVATKAEVQTSANAAQSTANAAQRTAISANNTAVTAKSTAEAARETAVSANNTAVAAQTAATQAVAGKKSGNNLWYYLSASSSTIASVTSLLGYTGGSGLEIEVENFSRPTLVFRPPANGVYQSDFAFSRQSSIYGHPKITEIGGIVMYASDDASKKFLITVNSSGTLSAAEVTDAS